MTDPGRIATLHQLPSMTDASLRRIVLAGLAADWESWTSSQLQSIGLPASRSQRIVAEARAADSESTAEQLRRLGVRVMTIDDPAYPPLLGQIHSPPSVLYVRGSISALTQPSLAVVGTRFPSPYGLSATARLVSPVVQHGISIISGLATGIDAVAHHSALEAKGCTVAVFGTGIDRVYPAHHHRLAEDIIARGGSVISEFPLGTFVARQHFPQRNRIISGLAAATLIIEAGSHSGALITAKFAVEQNRELLALPGPIDAPTSVGPNNWIRLGATLVRSAEDILEVFGSATGALPPPPAPPHSAASSWPSGLAGGGPAPAPQPNNPTEAIILRYLSAEPIHIDELMEKSRLDSSLVSATLSLMEINGLVQHLGGQYYCLVA